MDGTVLVADDDRTIRTVLTQALTRAGCRVHATASLTTLMRWVDEGMGDLVVTDVVMPDGNGLQMLPAIAARRPGMPVIVISAQNTIMTAIAAEEAAAFDYLPKPFDLPDLMKRVAKGLSTRIHRPVPEAPSGDERLPLVGRSAGMQALYKLVARVMNAPMPVLVTGESGTGKTLISRTIHRLGDRRNRPLVEIGGGDLERADAVAALSERAAGGSVLVEAVDGLSDPAQARLVQLLDLADDRAPRVLATARDGLATALEAGRIRDDLYYRITVLELVLPPVRARIEDIALLAAHFLEMAEADALPRRTIAPEAMALLREFAWPGNVRQLENAVRRLCATGVGPAITGPEVASLLALQPVGERALPEGGAERLSGSVAAHLRRYFDLHGSALPPPGLHPRILREIEGPLIEIALEACGGNQARCADLLGINRNTLRKKVRDLEIRVTRRRKLM